MDTVDIRAGMDVYDNLGDYIGLVTRTFPVLERFGGGPGSNFGCFKVRRGPLPFLGPPPLLVPFDAVRAIDRERLTVTVNVTREEAGRWETGRRSKV